MKKKFKYRIIQLENKAGGKIFYSQFQQSILWGLIKFWVSFYYSAQLQFLIDRHKSYDTYCDAVNAIKYHKMFGKDSDIKTIYLINEK